MNVQTVTHYLRLKPFDTCTEQGRTDERYRRAAWSILTNIVSKGMALLLIVFAVKWTVPYLGAERFGVWMTIASFSSMLTFLDLGIGNALTNHVAKAAIHDDLSRLQSVISGGLGFLFLLGIVMGILLVTTASILPWTNIIKVNDIALYDEIRHACILFAFLFSINLFTTGIQRVFTGLQQSYSGHLVAAGGSFLGLILLWFVSSHKASIPVLLLVTLGSQLFANSFLLLLLIKNNLLSLSGIRSAFFAEYSTLLRFGKLFFILQIGTMIGWGADSLIISSTLGATQVAVYAITQRLYQFVTQPLAIINAPLWGAYADANARNDKRFIRNTLIRSTSITALIAAISSVIIFIASFWIIDVWTEGTILVPSLFIAIFGCLTVCEATGNAFAMFLNGCNIVKQQVITVLILCLISLPLKIFSVLNYGITGMVASYVIIYTIIVTAMYGYFYKSNLRKYVYE